MTAEDRAQRTVDADALCAKAYESAGGGDVGCALIAVGGYGRAELAPHSDLDVVLVHDEGVDPGEVASQVWYPLWDSGQTIDHSVRRLDEMVAAADADLKVALGLVDIRHLAGDPNLTLRLRTTMLAHWRQQARERLPALQKLVRARHELMGELAHRSVPDLKESEGGLRDATVLKALTATWLVDVPHIELEQSRQALLDVLSGPGHLHQRLPETLTYVNAIRKPFQDAKLEVDRDAFPPVRREKPPRKGRDSAEVPSRVSQLVSAGLQPLRQLKKPRELSREFPEAEVRAMDAKWYRLASYDSAIVSMNDGTSAAFYQRDPEKFRELLTKTLKLHEQLKKEWPRLAQEYRAALGDITSPETWEQTLSPWLGQDRSGSDD